MVNTAISVQRGRWSWFESQLLINPFYEKNLAMPHSVEKFSKKEV
jgi:hypothetical protein